MSNVRYQPLSTEESDVAAETAHMALVLPPAQDTPRDTQQQPLNTQQQPQQQQLAAPQPPPPSEAPPVYSPPSYSLATSLPSYEEAERSKAAEAAAGGNPSPLVVMDECPLDRERQGLPGPEVDGSPLGTDLVFFLAFCMSFLFNWLGLLLSFCLSDSLAARYGSLSGFGLSMVKWLAVIKHVEWSKSMSDRWLYWLVVGLALLLFVHGLAQYLRAKLIVFRRQRHAGVIMMT